MSIKHELAGRLGFVYLMVIIIAVAIGVKALHVQAWEGDKWRGKSREFSARDFIVPPNRGDICAEDGRVLASSIPYYTLYFDGLSVLDSVFNKKVDSLSLKLSHFFGDASKNAYKTKLVNARNGKKPNRYLRISPRRVSYNELKEIRKFPILREKKNRNGLILKRENQRVLPHGSLARRTIGLLNENDSGVVCGYVGLEEAYEQELKGQNGRSIQQMMSGRWVAVTVEEPVDGNDVITTINIDYQDIVHNALLRQLEHHQADAGVAILMEVKSGDVKAVSNLSKTKGGYAELLNNAIGDAAEPGSVFKAAVMMALLEDGYVSPYDTVDFGNGRYTYYGRTMQESNHQAVGRVSVKNVFERSLNGISRLVYDNYKNNPEKFIDRLYDMHLNEKLGVELQGEGVPLIKHPKNKDWYGTTLPWMSIGYEVQLTPLQILAFYNTVANDGKRMKPRFVKEIRNKGEVIRRFHTEVIDNSICSKQTLRYLQEMMEGVVENGTAKNLKGTSYKIAGKTGTARIADGSKGYAVRRYRASFVGYFPADDPQYSCIVVVENPSSGGYYGNVVSGSVFREISDKVFALASLKKEEVSLKEPSDVLPVSKNGLKKDFLKIYDHLDIDIDKSMAEDADWVVTNREEEEIVLKPRNVDVSVVPNVKGMGLRDALYLLENCGLKVGVSGAGSVSQQSIQAGSKVKRGSYITIELR